MAKLGYNRFAVVGHDRGGRVAYRMALDHQDVVAKLAALDVIPTGALWDRADSRLMLGFWPFSLLAQPAPLPERLVGEVISLGHLNACLLSTLLYEFSDPKSQDQTASPFSSRSRLLCRRSRGP